MNIELHQYSFPPGETVSKICTQVPMKIEVSLFVVSSLFPEAGPETSSHDPMIKDNTVKIPQSNIVTFIGTPFVKVFY